LYILISQGTVERVLQMNTLCSTENISRA